MRTPASVRLAVLLSAGLLAWDSSNASPFPQQGPTTGGTRFTLTGVGFEPGAQVSLGGAPALDVVVWSPTRLEATSAPHAAGLVDAVVTRPSGGTVSLSGAFEYLESGCSVEFTPETVTALATSTWATVSATVTPTICAADWRSLSPWLHLSHGYTSQTSASASLGFQPNDGLARTGYVAYGNRVVAIEQAGNAAAADGDRDGLDDSWESGFGLNPSSASGNDGAMGDPDGDGLTNLEEYDRGSHPRGTFTRYFAEGVVKDDPAPTYGAGYPAFDTRFVVLNPGVTAASVLMRFMLTEGKVVTRPLSLAPRSVRSVDARYVTGLPQRVIWGVGLSGYIAEFATTVESDAPVVADRTVRWDHLYYGHGAHAETAIEAPAKRWYLAEGATHSGFRLYYLFQNPSDTATRAHVRYLLPSGVPLEKSYDLRPLSRTNVFVNNEEFEGLGRALFATDVSAVIDADAPIVVERAMYLGTAGQPSWPSWFQTGVFEAGHESAAIRQPATEWFLAEGATGVFFDMFVLIANPGDLDARIEATFLLPDGSTIARPYTVAANSRFNIWVDHADPRLADTAVSTTIRSTNDVPVVVERAMWWPGSNWYEAHNSPGATATGTRWAVADGEVGANGADTYVLIANTSQAAAPVTVTLVFEDGTTAARTFTVAGNSRFNVDVRTAFPSAVNRRFGAIVESVGTPPAPIVVERSMYWGGPMWTSGTNALATRLQ